MIGLSFSEQASIFASYCDVCEQCGCCSIERFTRLIRLTIGVQADFFERLGAVRTESASDVDIAVWLRSFCICEAPAAYRINGVSILHRGAFPMTALEAAREVLESLRRLGDAADRNDSDLRSTIMYHDMLVGGHAGALAREVIRLTETRADGCRGNE